MSMTRRSGAIRASGLASRGQSDTTEDLGSFFIRPSVTFCHSCILPSIMHTVRSLM